MTIIIASVSNKGYVTSSDGRTAYNEGIDSENEDKTFSLYDGKIRGAYAGMMSFGKDENSSARKVHEHIENISKQIFPTSLEEFAEFLNKKLLERIKTIRENEWSLKSRRLIVFLTGGKDLREKRFIRLKRTLLHVSP
jgi:hypothetical protein